jgi:hypothetical protein
MKSIQLLTITLALGLSLAACRTERKNTGNTPQQPRVAETIPRPPSAPSIQPSETPPPADIPENTTKTPVAIKSSEPSVEEFLLRTIELERAEVFAVPVSDEAARTRAEAWGKLATVDKRILSKEQYVYARDLLDRYREAPLLERLVFWRLVDLRLHNQGVSNTSRILGDDYRDLRLSMNSKLKDMLYSALGEDPEKLPDFLAARKAIEMLKAAAK